MLKSRIKRGEIYIANLDPVVGSEQGGERPVLVIQNNLGNRYSPTLIVLAITSSFNKKRQLPTHIPIESSDMSMRSIALAEQVRTIDKSRLIHYIGSASKASMEAVDKALKISLGDSV